MRPVIETFQAKWELGQMVAEVEAHSPARVLEVGTWHGGTLWHWLQIADKVVAVDDEMRREGDWYDWAEDAGADLRLIRGHSQDAAVIDAVDAAGPYDFLFIDADHSYASVRADWENYSPMVTQGGLVAFHDILPRPGYGVSQLWEELTNIQSCRYATICENAVAPGNEGRCGIGLIYL